MAATTGLGESSRAVRTVCRIGSPFFWPDVILPNSLMSAPAMNVRPPPMRTTARTAGSAWAAWRPARMPSGTPGLRAFTGGLLIVRTATSPSVVRVTRSDMSRMLPSCAPASANWERARRSVAEVPHAGEHHRQAVLVARLDRLRVAHRAAGLHDRRDAGRGRGVHVVAEREKRVGRHHRPPAAVA